MTTQKMSPRWIIAGLLAGFVAAITILLRIPIPKSSGYLNFGDVVIVFAGLYFGPLTGLLVGGVGSAIADAIGYPTFIIPTLIIKGLEGLLAGVLRKRLPLAGAVFGAAEMVAGYYLAYLVLFPGEPGRIQAISELPFNCIQGAVGVIGGYAMFRVINRWSKQEWTTPTETK